MKMAKKALKTGNILAIDSCFVVGNNFMLTKCSPFIFMK